MRTYLLWCHTFNVQWTLFIQKWDFLFKREFFVAIGDLYSNDNIQLTFFVDNLLLTKYLLTNLLLLMGVASMSELVESESPRPHYSKTGLGDLAIKLTNKNKHLKHDCMIMLISRWNSQLRRNIKIFNWTPVLTLIYIHSGSKIIELYRFVNIRIWIIMTNPRAKRDERLNRGTLKVW